MDKKEERIEKIYSRKRSKITQWLGSFQAICEDKEHFPVSQTKKQRVTPQMEYQEARTIKKICKILIVLIIAFMVVHIVLQAIEPIIDAECINMAKTIATRVSNEQATVIMRQYEYDDLTNIIKDEEGNIKLISTNIITVNQIISDIPNLIQKELEKEENSKFYLKLGSFTGSDIFAGRGPDIEMKMKLAGNVETNLKSEFSSSRHQSNFTPYLLRG